MQGSKLTFNNGSCTSKSIICYVETSSNPCVSYYTSVSRCAKKIHKIWTSITQMGQRCGHSGETGLELFTRLNEDFKSLMYELPWLNTGLLPATGSLCASLWHSSSGWWGPIIFPAPISRGQWKSLGQQSMLLERVRLCAGRNYFTIRTLNKKERERMGGRERNLSCCTCSKPRSCKFMEKVLQTCLCFKGRQMSRHFPFQAIWFA